MPRGIYNRKGKGKSASHRSASAMRQSLSKVTPHEICESFVQALIENNFILEENLFLILNDEAASKGYHLEARQQGIRGTYIAFRR